MFEYFEDKAIRAIMLAQEEARRLKHNMVGSEHLLVGLIAEGTAIAATVLNHQGVSLEAVRNLIEARIGRGTGSSSANLPFTPKVKAIFGQSFNQARQLNHTIIKTEHLLLAIAAAPETLAANLLVQLGVDLEQLQSHLHDQIDPEMVSTAMGDATRPPSFASGSRRQSALAAFGSNLTQLAREGKLDPTIGRHREVERIIQILGRRTKNNPLLVGEPGVGKTAIAEGLAQRIIQTNIPNHLAGYQVISLDMGLLLAGTRFRGEFESRLKAVVNEVKTAGDIILFIDEVHTLMGSGVAGEGISAANLLKPALARGELQCLGSTTLDEYQKYIEQDAALERRFQLVKVDEPSIEETIAILQGLRKVYEAHHQVKIDEGALAAAAQLSARYINHRCLPDKAIDLIDEAGSRVHLQHALKIRQWEQQKTEFTADVPTIHPQALTPIVDAEAIAQVVTAWTGVPVQQLSASEAQSCLQIEAHLHERIVGQEEAVAAVSRAIRRTRSGMKHPKRPIASFFFAGPTGVGKTELAKALSAYLFETEAALIRVDMSELMDAHTTSKLIGSPPGFLGYEEGGQLTEAVRRRPYAIVLFDEVEKAHPDVFHLLLQLLDEGQLTDAQGRQVDFKNTVIIMTSNLGSKVIEKGGQGLGFNDLAHQPDADYHQLRQAVNDELKHHFRPEFLNRLDEIIVFRPLNLTEVEQIAHLLLQEVSDRLLEQREMALEVTPAFKALVVSQGYDPKYGARPLRRAIMRLLEDSLAEAILSGKLSVGGIVTVDADEMGNVLVEPLRRPSLALQSVH